MSKKSVNISCYRLATKEMTMNIADATVGDKIFNYNVIIWPLSRREAVQVPFLFNRKMGSLRVAGTL